MTKHTRILHDIKRIAGAMTRLKEELDKLYLDFEGVEAKPAISACTRKVCKDESAKTKIRSKKCLI